MKGETTDKLDYSKEFLIADFIQCYELLRHYNEIGWSITRFAFVELVIGIGAVWAVYSFAVHPDNVGSTIESYHLYAILAILAVCYVFSLLASFLLTRNRVYFTKVSRYLNEHRKLVLSEYPFGFTNETNFYTNIDFPTANNPWSTQLISLYAIQLLSCLILFIIINIVTALTLTTLLTTHHYILSLVLCIAVTVSILFLCLNYTKTHSARIGAIQSKQ